MTPRFDIAKHMKSAAVQALLKLSHTVETSGLERSLLELVKIRASQINGCAYCLDMHTKDARALGETEQRIYGLNAWHETPYFTPRERAALAWTEAVTRVADTRVPDDVYEEVRPHFTEEELLSLTFEVMVINSWNRLAIASRALAGTYQPQTQPVTA
jgi:AhpD family alkylhydroperoxidase